MSPAVSLLEVPDDKLRDLAISAHALVLVHSARAYGLIAGGPGIDVEQCERAIALTADRGLPAATEDEIDEAVVSLVCQLAAPPDRADAAELVRRERDRETGRPA